MPLGTPAPPPVRRSGIRWDRLLDRFSIYLPVLLMAALALGSYWLLRATPEALAPEAARPATSEPDYFMRRFAVKVFDAQGALKTEVLGAEARHHPDRGDVEIDNARIRSFNLQGQLTTATAQRVISNDAQTEFVLDGDAIVVREAGRRLDGADLPRLEFRGERLRIEMDPQHLRSDLPVTLFRGSDRIEADSLDYVGEERVAVLKGRVKAQFVSR